MQALRYYHYYTLYCEHCLKAGKLSIVGSVRNKELLFKVKYCNTCGVLQEGEKINVKS